MIDAPGSSGKETHFISYSTIDGRDLAARLHDALAAGPPIVQVWLDSFRLHPGEDWDEEIAEAISQCASFLLVMTPDSTSNLSVCKQELITALRYKKPIVPLRFSAECELPFRINTREYLDFVPSFDAGMARLRNHLRWLGSPAGILQQFKYRRKDAERRVKRTESEIERQRLLQEIEELDRQIEHWREVAEDPTGAKAKTDARVEDYLDRKRQPSGRPPVQERRARFINAPPSNAPSWFQDRVVETAFLGQFLKDPALRLVTVVGRAGVGKMAMVCRLLKSLEAGVLPDDAGALNVDGIVYLRVSPQSGRNAAALFADLTRLLPSEVALRLENVYKTPISIADKFTSLLTEFPSGRTVVLLDNFEDIVDIQTGEMVDAEFEEALRAILAAPANSLKVIITTRDTPRALVLSYPGAETILHLDKGLPSPFAENILREMDSLGVVGLKTASADLLSKARERTQGFPRGLEALFMILSEDPSTSLNELLEDKRLLPETVVEKLVGEAFRRLDRPAQMVMQALAIFGRPVGPGAVDFVLNPYLPGVDSTPVLKRLGSKHFVRSDGGYYYLHPVDAEFALSRIPVGTESDGPAPDTWFGRSWIAPEPDLDDVAADSLGRLAQQASPFTQVALRRQAANYLKKRRAPRSEWKSIKDLEPHLAEIELRCATRDFDAAARVLNIIDFDYLRIWGHYRLIADLRESFRSKLSDPELQLTNLNVLGAAYLGLSILPKAEECFRAGLALARELGNRRMQCATLNSLAVVCGDQSLSDQAIAYLQEGLEIAKTEQDQEAEAAILGNLGLRFEDQGDSQKAIEYLEQALRISRELKDKLGEEGTLHNLGSSYRALGQTAKAMEMYTQALALVPEVGYREWEANHLATLGNCQSDLGNISAAIEFHSKALSIRQEIGNLDGEAEGLTRMAELLIDERRYTEAISKAGESMLVVARVNTPSDLMAVKCALASAYIYVGDHSLAAAAAADAAKCDVPNNHKAFTLLGVALLRSGDHTAAQEAFERAISRADFLLRLNQRRYMALYDKALALCGLVACGRQECLAPAKETYRAARSINCDSGMLLRAVRLLDVLRVVDADELLVEVRAVATGQSA